MVFINLIWRPPNGLTPKTTKARIVRFEIVQSPHSFSELTHTSSEASIYTTMESKSAAINTFKCALSCIITVSFIHCYITVKFASEIYS